MSTDFTVLTPSGYSDRFGLSGKARTLEDLFDRYYWKREYYAVNSEKLLGFQRQLRSAIGGDPAGVHHVVAQIMDWGLNPSAAQANKAWAAQQGIRLPALLEAGKRALESADPDYSVFLQVRMNAGFTKVFSLLCEDIIIYDGRVGAALCWLVRRFLKHIGYAEPVPKALACLRAPGRSAQHRNPGGDGFEFGCLTSDAPAWPVPTSKQAGYLNGRGLHPVRRGAPAPPDFETSSVRCSCLAIACLPVRLRVGVVAPAHRAGTFRTLLCLPITSVLNMHRVPSTSTNSSNGSGHWDAAM